MKITFTRSPEHVSRLSSTSAGKQDVELDANKAEENIENWKLHETAANLHLLPPPQKGQQNKYSTEFLKDIINDAYNNDQYNLPPRLRSKLKNETKPIVNSSVQPLVDRNFDINLDDYNPVKSKPGTRIQHLYLNQINNHLKEPTNSRKDFPMREKPGNHSFKYFIM